MRESTRVTAGRGLRAFADGFAALLLPLGAWAQAAQPMQPLQTWHPWQLDSILVVWALTKAQARPIAVESVVRGQPIDAGRAIDTPESPYRRTGQRTAFEEAVRRHQVHDPCVERLREAVRLVELASWRKPEFPSVEEFEARVLKVIPQRPMAGGLEPAMAEVERYCAAAR
jgi:hypothetical protein